MNSLNTYANNDPSAAVVSELCARVQSALERGVRAWDISMLTPPPPKSLFLTYARPPRTRIHVHR